MNATVKIILLATLLLGCIGLAAAQPPVPMTIYGYVHVDGELAPSGLDVYAKHGVDIVDQTTTDAGYYLLSISYTSGLENGAPIDLWVEQHNITRITLAYFIVLEVNLTIPAAPPQLDLSAYAGDYVNITVIARDYGENPSDEIILYVDEIPEGEWCPVVLQPKWNLISLPLIPNSTARADVLSLVLKQGANGVIITHGYNQTIDDWDTDPAEMTDGWGYWLYVLEYDVLIVQGTETPTPPAMPPTYLFTEGWVLAGFKSTSTSTIAEYIVSLETDSYFPYVYVWDAIIQNWEMLDKTKSLNPGDGFWIWMYEDQYLIPPI